MIALRDNLPLVRFHDGTVINFERRWLSGALLRAAESAGYKKWWLADHVTESVTNYLEQDFVENIVPIARLEKAVQSVLQVIGYEDVARCFRTSPPPIRLSLVGIARDAGHGYELVFFKLLRLRIAEALASPALEIELCDLQPCVKLLRSTKHWGQDCTGLRNEIVVFVRGEVHTNDHGKNLTLQLS